MNDLPAMSEINARATAFLERREFENWDEADERELSAWLSESKAHCAAFWRLEAAWERTHRLAALKQEHVSHAGPLRTARRLPGWSRIAAASIAIAVIVAGFYAFQPQDTVYRTPLGGRQTVTLADGSEIELNTDTVLSTRLTSTSRSAVLVQGEVYFRIRHDAKRPFVVTANGKTITDLGTVFTVRNDAGRVRVALFEGKARVDMGGKPIILSPGDKLIATASRTVVSHEQPQTLSTDLGWRRGIVIFKRTTLAEVAAEFNRYNQTKLVIADPQTARLTVGGTFPADNVELFGRMASEILGLRVTRRGTQIVISR